MLWSVVDFISSKTEGDGGSGDDGCRVRVRAAPSPEVWSAMMDELRRLSVDARPEVRNCAVNTLASSVAANGSALSYDQWLDCLSGEV